MFSSFSEFAASKWINAFKARPTFTTVITALAVLLAATATYLDTANREAEQNRRIEENLVLNNQIESLNDMEASARELILFVERQRDQLIEAERVVERLQNERESLEPVVNADREAIEAVFALQEERSESKVWKERWIGFGLGVIASLLASIVIGIVRYFLSRNSEPDPPKPAV